MRQEVMSLSLFRIQWADREHPETAPGILGAEAASALTTRRPGYAGGGGGPRYPRAEPPAPPASRGPSSLPVAPPLPKCLQPSSSPSPSLTSLLVLASQHPSLLVLDIVHVLIAQEGAQFLPCLRVGPGTEGWPGP